METGAGCQAPHLQVGQQGPRCLLEAPCYQIVQGLLHRGEQGHNQIMQGVSTAHEACSVPTPPPRVFATTMSHLLVLLHEVVQGGGEILLVQHS